MISRYVDPWDIVDAIELEPGMSAVYGSGFAVVEWIAYVDYTSSTVEFVVQASIIILVLGRRGFREEDGEGKEEDEEDLHGRINTEEGRGVHKGRNKKWSIAGLGEKRVV